MISSRSIALFQKASHSLPAYYKFLKSEGVNAHNINSVELFNSVPLTNKNNYLKNYPLSDLVWPDDLNQLLLFCSTSGSTGEPYYFPRNENLSRQYSVLVEDFLLRGSISKPDRTLVILGFGMGVWIGGIITLKAFELAAQRLQAPISILPIGYNKTEIFKALKKLAPSYDQIIIAGYPPFIKELVDEAPGEDIKLAELNIRFLFAAEAFTETFRDYVCKKAGIKRPLLDTLNIYGTADIGAMAYETPLTIMIRRLADKDPLLFKDIFGQIEKTPTLTQYNPEFIEFEELNGEIILTGNAAMPLIRYSVGDNGGVIEYEKMLQILHRSGYELGSEMDKAGIKDTLQKQPFVFVYERKDLSVTIHGINVYPEFIKEGLLNSRLTPYLTERFTMIAKLDRKHNQHLEINLELQNDIVADTALEKLAAKTIRGTLIKKSSEFAEISKSQGSKDLIRLVFWPNNHPRYFTAGVKQKWVQTD